MTIKESTEENFDGIFEIVFAPASWAHAAFPDFSLNFSFLPAKK